MDHQQYVHDPLHLHCHHLHHHHHPLHLDQKGLTAQVPLPPSSPSPPPPPPPPRPPVMVVMVPFPAQGHLNQLLHFSRLIAAYNIPVHYVGSTTHNRQAKLRLHGWDPLSISNLHFHDFPLPPFLNPPPDPNASIKFPAHLQPAFDASLHLRKPISSLLHSLSLTSQRLVIIYDPLMAFAAQDVSSLPNGEAYAFHSVSAFAIVFYLWESLGRPIEIPIELSDLSLEGCSTTEFQAFIRSQYDLMSFNKGDLYNTCRAIEGRFMDMLGQRQWAIGPLNPVTLGSSGWRHKCLEWLDMQPRGSVLYLSFGTMTSMSHEQIAELAVGLERSRQRFIWVFRDADRGDIFAKENDMEVSKAQAHLPKGYEERIQGVGLGMIVRDWAPQLEILAHPSTGGFLSHCGWNSCMETISMGVPIAAWPMHSDQPRNPMLVTQVLRVGLVVREWAQRQKLVTRTTIKSAVKRLMASEEGDDIRRRAKELGVAVRQSVANGGTSRAELDSFISHISR
ncbi:zeatin O-glucosyltransferase-like [Macadamia integrifolia]|uniref:zeatin O-glucosyltransferase-like n=1 Tax=Macadamia integrifolia TaxID=60698 RepID=UPI001C4F59FD|nr:zeatin O-glucosyltransferase-like [Macadamia integrifolia]